MKCVCVCEWVCVWYAYLYLNETATDAQIIKPSVRTHFHVCLLQVVWFPGIQTAGI